MHHFCTSYSTYLWQYSWIITLTWKLKEESTPCQVNFKLPPVTHSLSLSHTHLPHTIYSLFSLLLVTWLISKRKKIFNFRLSPFRQNVRAVKWWQWGQQLSLNIATAAGDDEKWTSFSLELFKIKKMEWVMDRLGSLLGVHFVSPITYWLRKRALAFVRSMGDECDQKTMS